MKEELNKQPSIDGKVNHTVNKTASKHSVKSRKSLWFTIACVIAGIVMVLIAIYLVYGFKKQYYGEWNCMGGFVVTIDKKRFDIYLDNQNNIKATYEVVGVERRNGISVYSIVVSSTRIVLDGLQQDEQQYSAYDLYVDENSKDEIGFINYHTGDTYYCQRNKK